MSNMSLDMIRQFDDTCRITAANIEDFRGAIAFGPGDLPFDLWEIFDERIFRAVGDGRVVQLENIVSTRNQLADPRFLAGEKPDPRQTAFDRMVSAGKGLIDRRAPLKAQFCDDGMFYVEDGNATVQVLMFVGWAAAAVEVLGSMQASAQKNAP